jgi:hypothetical protein
MVQKQLTSNVFLKTQDEVHSRMGLTALAISTVIRNWAEPTPDALIDMMGITAKYETRGFKGKAGDTTFDPLETH